MLESISGALFGDKSGRFPSLGAPGAGSEVLGDICVFVPHLGPKKSEYATSPQEQPGLLNRHCQSHFDLQVHFLTFV